MTRPETPVERKARVAKRPDWPRASRAGLRFRTIAETDRQFLSDLYASTRWDELGPTRWEDAQKREFLAQQFAAQHAHYMQHYPQAEWLVIEQAERQIGRLYFVHWGRELRIVDIALIPAARGMGFGSAVLGDLIAEAAAGGKPVTIHVERTNPALSLYRRLGFREAEDKGVYLLLERPPAPQVNIAS